MKFYISILLLTLSLSVLKIQCECDPNDTECHEKEKYKREKNVDQSKWEKYLNEIKKVNKEYVECESTNCSCYFGQIEHDLEPWKTTGITQEMIKKAASLGRLSHYQIIDHKLYRDKEEMFPFRNKGVEHFLLEIVDQLPDMEFILNTHDWPQVNKWNRNVIPVFSFSKVDHESYDIMYPNWAFWEGGPAVWPIYSNGLGRWDQQLKIIQKEAKKWPWDKKVPKVFFRGSRTSEERDPLILLSRAKPDLVDAQYTKNQAWRSDKDTLGAKPAEEVKLEDHCKYKYLFNFRGVAASFRLRHLFPCNSLVYHVGSEWLEFFYNELKPWVHYIPVDKSLNNLEEIIEFAVENDAVAKKIAKRGKKFIIDHLKMDDITCYWKHLLEEYAKLLKYKVQRNKEFLEIKN